MARSGTAAPAANSASELVAAVHGEPSSPGFTPNTVRAVKSKKRCSSSGSSVEARSAVSVAKPASTNLSVSSPSTSRGLRCTSARSSARIPRYSSTWLRTLTHSPAAIDSAPATRLARPATRTAPAELSAPATARIRQMLVTSPSFTPSTAGTRPAAGHRVDPRLQLGRIATTVADLRAAIAGVCGTLVNPWRPVRPGRPAPRPHARPRR